ncbi:MAG: hypothetical protein ACREOH_14420 [Candidatus Entotheonellia bacterium]
MTKALVWMAVGIVSALAIVLPVIVVTGMFGGHPLAGTIALAGLIMLVLGVAWYVKTRGGTI